MILEWKLLTPFTKEKIKSLWPKKPILLSDVQKKAREEFMMEWHKLLPKKYNSIETFNQKSITKWPLPHPGKTKTLEIGAGIGAHAEFENHSAQDYYFLEYREEFCKKIKERYPNVDASRIICNDIHQKTPFDDATFDRIVAIHVLEHLGSLPAALDEICRLLKPDGVLDIVLPCEGIWLYSLARIISAKRFFEKRFKMSYTPIIKSEHVNTIYEILPLLRCYFTLEESSQFPGVLPSLHANLVIALRFKKHSLVSKNVH